jgi:cytoskeletal protein CcmA (bactofilin family)
MAKSKNNNSTSDNYIVEGSEIKGNIKAVSNIRIDGRLEGNVNTARKLILGNTGFLKGDVICQNALIEGIMEGSLTVADKLELRSGSKINGNIVSSKLILEENCHISGSMKLKK